MISIYAFSLFLWICLAVQVPAEGTFSKITKVKRVDLGDDFKLIVEFEGDSTVEAWWWKYDGGQEVNLTGSKLANGKATLKLSKEEHRDSSILLRLGHIPSHFVDLRWNVNGDGDRVSTRECPLAVITPGQDLTYVPALEVKIAVEEGRGLDHLSFPREPLQVLGQYWDEASNSAVLDEVFSFLKQSQESQNGMTINTLTFEAGANEPIVGYFQGMMNGYADDRDKAPVLQMLEYFTLVLHEKGEEIPFPYDLN